MLTQLSGTVDSPPRAVMWPIRDIAARDGVSKQAISTAVARLVKQHELTVERDGRGRIRAVNVAEYDHLRGHYRDPSKDQRPQQVVPLPPLDLAQSESYDEATRQRAWLAAEREKLALAEKKKELISVAGVADALVSAGADIARLLDRLVNATDDLANAVARDGVHGLRVEIKKSTMRMRNEIADVLARVAADAPVLDEPDLAAAELDAAEASA